MAVHKSKAAKKKFRNEVLLLITVLVAVFLVGGLFFWLWDTRDVAPDKVTLCPETGATAHTILLVDNTEPYTFMQRQAFKQSLRELARETMKEGELLSVFVLGDDFQENAEPIFEKCHPGVGEGKSDFNANIARIKKRFEHDFREPIVGLMDKMLKESPSKYSPVYEMLQLVSINGFRRANVDGPKRLIVFSDMLPNTKEFSMFKGIPEYDAFMRSGYGRNTVASLEGVQVIINILVNYPDLQTTKQVNFWEKHLENSGAELLFVNPLRG